MDADDIDWLRDNRNRIRIGTEGGQAFFEVDDYELFDALDDYLSEVLDDRLGEVWHRDLWDNPTATSTYQLGFRDLSLTPEQLREVLERI